MKKQRRICVVTGGRPDYGLVYWVMKEILRDETLRLQVVATGSHLAPEFGSTYRAIEQDGFKIEAKVEMLLSSDTPVGVAKSIGLATIGFADTYDRLKPDLVLLAGDRFELLAAAQAALIARIPVAHLFGGDTTEGAYDEAIRHSITKMAHLHFVSNELSARRVRQLGEDPRHIYNFGSPALDCIRHTPLLSRGELEQSLGYRFRRRNLLITFHPVTLGKEDSLTQCDQLLRALKALGKDVGLIFTRPNADNEGRYIASMINEFVEQSEGGAVCYDCLGRQQYLSLLAIVDAIVGNSSSGIYEAPTLHKPTVNIGDRQKGRFRATSVIDCDAEQKAIEKAITKAYTMDCSDVVNPYGNGDSAPRIVQVLRDLDNFESLTRKQFHLIQESR